MIEKKASPSVREQPVPENEQVAIALRPRTIGPLLEQLFRLELEQNERQSGATGTASPTYDCQILDAKYEPGNYCTILYQLGDDLVIGTYKWDSDEGLEHTETQLTRHSGRLVSLDTCKNGISRVDQPGSAICN